jgi:hypothetical protein
VGPASAKRLAKTNELEGPLRVREPPSEAGTKRVICSTSASRHDLRSHYMLDPGSAAQLQQSAAFDPILSPGDLEADGCFEPSNFFGSMTRGWQARKPPL